MTKRPTSRGGVFFAALMLGALLSACGSDRPLLEQIQASGQLRVLTRNNPTTYYYGSEGLTGFEYELASRFAASIGVEPRFVVAGSFAEILPRIARGEAHLAAAGITVTERRRQQVRFGHPVQTVRQQVVYRTGTRSPREVADLVGRYIEVVAGSSYVERLEELRHDWPELSWHESDELSSDQILDLVSEKLIDLTVADSNLVALNRRLNTELRIGFDFSGPQQLAWAFPHSDDDSLYNAANEFLRNLDRSGTLKQLQDRYYGHTQRFDYVGTRAFRRHIALRLPRYRAWFEAAAKQYGLDWRLLAAMGYQESHWRPDAVSPTGVRGIMMLTRAAAEQVEVEDRTDPRQSIFGGARYLRLTRGRIPKQIPEPDRTWLALAAYNIGLGHLRDARTLTKDLGQDPNRWVDLKEVLPLLSQETWYKQTRYGYARGQEPVRYVQNVRRYHDLLASILTPVQPPPAASSALSVSAPAL